MVQEVEEKVSVIGRNLKAQKKYGSKGTGFLGKVVMSSGENPVLGRRLQVDLAHPHVMLICGKRGYGKCVTGDTLITLANGQVCPIKDLADNPEHVMGLDENHKITPQVREGFYTRKVEKLLRVRTRSGKEIKLTPEHPLPTLDGWTEAKDIPVGGRIAAPRKLDAFGPGFLKECEIKLLAYLLAEGHTKRSAVWFSNSDEMIVRDFMESVKNFDNTLEVKPYHGNSFRVAGKLKGRTIINDKRKQGKFSKGIKFAPYHTLKRRLQEWGVYDLGAKEKFFPQEIFSLPKTKLALFLNRLFSCDGTIWKQQKRYWRVSYCSSSEKMIRQVQHLLLRFEILSKLRRRMVRYDNKRVETFDLTVDGRNLKTFLIEIGFFGEKEKRQKRALKENRDLQFNENVDTIPKEIWNYYKPENWAAVGRKMGYKHPKALRESARYSPSRQKLLQIAKADGQEFIAQLAESDIFWDEIVEKEELTGSFQVYDISVPGAYNFVANDLIIHNSFSMTVLMEEFARLPTEIRHRTSVIVIDTVGIFWGLKIPDSANEKEIRSWGLEPGVSDVRVLVPKGRLSFYKDIGVPIDGAFTLKASELSGVEWMALFELTWRDPEGVLITRIVEHLQEKLGTYYGIDEIIKAIEQDSESETLAKQALINRMIAAKSWGLIEKKGTRLSEIAKPGSINIIDVSAYRTSVGMAGTREIIVAMLGKRLFEERMLFRKEEEIRLIRGEKRESQMPIVWMMIDEAHMFMPKDRPSIALQVLLEWVRVGRQPGLSLVLATQRTNKLHPDAISQCDIFISHRMTAQEDIAAVANLRPSYLHQSFDQYYAMLPRSPGFAIVLDDNSEKLWTIKIRPRLSWDASVTATSFTY